MLDPTTKTNRAMIIAPLDPSGEQVRDAVRQVLQELGMEVFRADTLQVGSNLTYEIINAIESSDLIIADVSKQNPNVFYELGFAHALRKPTLLMTSQEGLSRVPTDLSSNHYLIYDLSNLSDFQNTLKRMIQRNLVTA